MHFPRNTILDAEGEEYIMVMDVEQVNGATLTIEVTFLDDSTRQQTKSRTLCGISFTIYLDYLPRICTLQQSGQNL